MISPSHPRLIAVLLCVSLLLVACRTGGTAPVEPPRASPSPAATATLVPPRIELETSLETTTYPVQGATTEAIFSYIEANGPTDGMGNRGSGVTSVVWAYEWTGEERRDGSCSIRQMTLRADLSVKLPVHADTGSLSPSMQLNWQAYADGVAEHEQTHVDIYLEGAREIKRLMEQIGLKPSCDELESTIRGIWSTQQARINGLQDAFHMEEDLRLEAARGPLEAQIERNRAEMRALQSEVDGLDARIRQLRQELTALDLQVENVDEQIRQINAITSPLPQHVRDRLQELIDQSEALLTTYNAKVDEHNSALSRRNALASQHDSLVSATNQLVEQFNWAR